MCAGSVAPTTAPIPLSPSGPDPASRSAKPSTSAARRSCSGSPGAGRSWRSAAPGLLVRTRAKTPAPAAAAASTSGSSASPPSSGLAVKASAPSPGTGAPGRRRLADQRLGVGGGGDRHVAALAVGDHQQAGLGRGLADLGQRRPAGRAEALEAGELRLDRDAGRAGALDQRPAVGGDGTGRQLGRRALDRGPEVGPGQLRRVGVETEADLAAALFDERRQPVREGSSGQLSP